MGTTKERIMTSAFKLFLEKGLTDVAMSEIKKASEVSTGTFYHYFSSKEDLIIDVMEEYVFSYFDMALKNISGFEGDSKEELYYITMQIIGYDINKKKWAEFYTNMDISDYRRIHLLYLDGIQKYEKMAKRYEEFNLKLLDFIADILRHGQLNHEIIDGDIGELSYLIQSTINGTFLMWIAIPELDLINLMKSNLNHMWNYLEYRS